MKQNGNDYVEDEQRVSLRATTTQSTPQTDQESHSNFVIAQHLLENVPEYRELSHLRKKGWNNPEGDRFFQKQRRSADEPNERTKKFFYKMMIEIGQQMHQATAVFKISDIFSEQPSVLDMCMAPGGFLAVALELNPEARIVGFSLPFLQGGHKVLLPDHPSVKLKFLDITMLAEDMGVTEIPAEHPDASEFLPRQFEPQQTFDLVICDGQVLRTHNRAPYRNQREARRLILTQLVLGLEHMNTGGTMIVLLHKVETWHTVCLLYRFIKFSSIRLFKSRRSHATRSSFYMLCTNVQNNLPEAIHAIECWRKEWKVATFGTDQEYQDVSLEHQPDAEQVRDEFGPQLAEFGKEIWEIQAKALAKASYVKGQPDSV